MNTEITVGKIAKKDFIENRISLGLREQKEFGQALKEHLSPFNYKPSLLKHFYPQEQFAD